MLIGEIIAVALGALRANKMRSMLTMLGIVIGVAAVIAMVAIGSGAQAAVKDRINALGTTLLTVNPGQQRGMGGVSVGGQNAKLTESGLRTLAEYTWPGNVRQIQHMIERLVILTTDGRIDEDGVRAAIESMDPRPQAGETLADTEAEQIRRVLSAAGGNKSRAAKILGIERKTLYRKLDKMGL